MRRMLAFVGGLLSGGVIGTAAALLLTPQSGESMRRALRERWQAARQAGDEAAARRRVELEARLIEMTGPHSADSPLLKVLQPPAGNGHGNGHGSGQAARH